MKESWQKVAVAGELLLEDESYTGTFALSLGLQTRQEIAISVRFS